MIFNGLFFCQKKVKIINKIFGKMEYSSYVSFVIRDKDMKIREFYCEAYPTDDLGVEINSEANFADLWVIIRSGNIYEYLGVCDSVIRERVFEKFAKITGHDIDYIYEEWINA